MDPNATVCICLQPSDEYGSPTLDEIAVFSQQFSDEYHKAMGEAAEDVGVEVSSPVSSTNCYFAAILLQICASVGILLCCMRTVTVWLHVLLQCYCQGHALLIMFLHGMHTFFVLPPCCLETLPS